MLDRENKILYIHIPKTGGYAIGSALIAAGLNMQFEGSKHAKYTDYKNVGNFFTLFFVRNPFDLEVSKYHHNVYNLKRKKFTKYGSFKKYIKKAKLSLQSDYVKNSAGKIEYSFMGRFERLEDDYEDLCLTLGIKNKLSTIGKINTSDHKDYHEYYDDKTREILEEKLGEDLDNFGYRF